MSLVAAMQSSRPGSDELVAQALGLEGCEQTPKRGKDYAKHGSPGQINEFDR
jgi:hypothetical protein